MRRANIDGLGIVKYRREIDGLRAIAVVPVIFFHAGFETFSGGFVGVDVFFVISGYLITSILIRELEQGNFSIVRFYERRARRILPALFMVMFASIPFAWMWMFPSQLKDFFQSIAAVSLFSSNILFWREAGYFGAASELKPLLHTWSIAVEEQYYLLFPPFLMLLWRFGRSKVLWTIIAFAFLSLLLSEWGWRNMPSANFFLAPTRAWELFAGSICAFLMVGREQRENNPLSLIGLILIITAIFYFDQSSPFPSLYALVPVTGTALIVLFAGKGTLVAKFLSLRWIVGIGLISYSAYLWHQPIFAFARLRSLREPSDGLMLTLAGVSLVIAYFSWRFVEQPFRKRPVPLIGSRNTLFATSGALGAAFLAFGLFGSFQNGFPDRSVASNDLAEIEDRVGINYGLSADCEGYFNKSPNCRTSDEPEFLLWGDSFAMQLVQGLIASDPNLAIQQNTRSSCSPILNISHIPGGRTLPATECIEFNKQVFGWLEQNESVKFVVLSSPFSGVLSKDLFVSDGKQLARKDNGNLDYVASQMMETVDRIRQTGKRVVVVSPTPRSGFDTGQCLIRMANFGGREDACDFTLENRPLGQNFELMDRISAFVPVIRLDEFVCPGGTCDVMQDGIFIYRDGGHLSEGGSAYLGEKIGISNLVRDLAN